MKQTTAFEQKVKLIDDQFKKKNEDIYSATPALVDDVDFQFEEIYKNAIKYDDDDRIIYMLPIDLSDGKTEKLLQMTNGVILQDSLEHSDSISSVDDVPRIYNVGTGTIVQNAKTKLYKNTNEDLNKENKNSTDQLPDTIKEELVELPSVKAIAKKFFAEKKLEPIVEKVSFLFIYFSKDF